MWRQYHRRCKAFLQDCDILGYGIERIRVQNNGERNFTHSFPDKRRCPTIPGNSRSQRHHIGLAVGLTQTIVFVQLIGGLLLAVLAAGITDYAAAAAARGRNVGLFGPR